MWRSAAAFAVWVAAAATLSPGQPRSPDEALHAAVQAGKLEQVKRLLAAGADVNARDPLGSTPLFVASCLGNTDVASLLLADGALVDAGRPDAPSSPLECAVLTDHADIVKLLLASRADVDTRCHDDQSLLHVAARRGNAQIAEVLLRAHADISSVDANGNTALDQAVLDGQSQVVSLLIAHGANVARVHPLDGRGPLHEACIKGFATLVPTLITARADPSQRDHFGQTPLDLALAYKNRNVVTALLQLAVHATEVQATAEQAMQSSIARGQTEIARMLIESGFDIAKPTLAGPSYLQNAALKGHKKMVQVLLDHGARVNAADRDGATALHDAALGGNPDVITLLLDHGARIDAAEEQSGATPLMLAAAMARTQAVAVLLARGANPAIKDRHGRTALDRAKETQDDDLVKLLETAVARLTPNQSAS
ncbi:MAG: ankyrin repeat domain-containing protein [Acidobacteriales bacterium]|nr:ankyrin repeat domain-containing protein [Terriglobales bacterium]